MEWWLALLFIFGGLMVLMASGLPVAFAFLLINIVGISLFWGGQAALVQLTLSIYASLTNFALLPVPMFFLMGEIMFQSGVAFSVIDALDKWLGRVHGRLSLLAVGSGTLLSVLTGVPMASVALMGTVLVPEMEKRGYKKVMTLGPILGSGGLAMLIPPSGIAVLLAALAELSVAKVLIGGIIPGLMLAAFFAVYIIIRCRLQPSLAPSYEVAPPPLRERVGSALKYIVPLGIIVFLVIGVMLLGIATPTEAAATGVLGCFILAAFHKQLNWEVLKKSLLGTMKLTVMVLIIIAGSTAFSQMLAFSGGSKGLVEVATGLPLSPIILIITMQIVLLILGCFMELLSIMMITIPIFFPIILGLGINPLWFGILMLLNMEVGPITPPFGLELFVMKGVVSANTTMGDIYRAAIPFILMDIWVLALMLVFPAIALWLPGIIN
ncbi:TRAP transporter large permease subunit [Chloroflexota bacterium]